MSDPSVMRRALYRQASRHPWLWGGLAVLLLCIVVFAARSLTDGQPAAAALPAESAAHSPGIAEPSATATVKDSAGLVGTTELSDTAFAPAEAPYSTGQDWLSITGALGALILVLGAIYASLWALRRFTMQRRHGSGAAILELNGSVRLGANQSLHVVRFGSRVLLVGSSPSGLSLLAADPQPAVETPVPAGTSFKDALALAEEAGHAA